MAMLERSRVPTTRIDRLQAVKGYLVPRYVEYMDDGRRVGALGEKDIQRVKDGYACGECLAYFGQRFPVCPSCGHMLDPNKDIVDYNPDHWQPYEGRTSQEILESRPDSP